DASPAIDQTHRVRRHGTDTSRVVMGEELRLVSRHVDVDRTLALAAFAREAQIQRLVHSLVPPAALKGVALHHLEQQPGASAGGMLLLARDHVAGAHHAAALTTAVSDAHASGGGPR